jgi:hypothetical protein
MPLCGSIGARIAGEDLGRPALNMSATNEKAAARAAFFARQESLFARLVLTVGVAC